MELKFVEKGAFTVIGHEGSTLDGAGFVQRLWAQTSGAYDEIRPLVITAANGKPCLWGAMTDFSRSFLPWEKGLSRGLYMAGAECEEGAEAPAGWARWRVPAFRFAVAENTRPESLQEGLDALKNAGLALAGAVQEYSDPEDGKEYLYFPVERL